MSLKVIATDNHNVDESIINLQMGILNCAFNLLPSLPEKVKRAVSVTRNDSAQLQHIHGWRLKTSRSNQELDSECRREDCRRSLSDCPSLSYSRVTRIFCLNDRLVHTLPKVLVSALSPWQALISVVSELFPSLNESDGVPWINTMGDWLRWMALHLVFIDQWDITYGVKWQQSQTKTDRFLGMGFISAANMMSAAEANIPPFHTKQWAVDIYKDWQRQDRVWSKMTEWE